MTRASKWFAEKAKETEEWYRKEAEKIVFNNKLLLEEDGNDIYVTDEGKRQFLHTIEKKKKKWYEIWYKLKNIYPYTTSLP